MTKLWKPSRRTVVQSGLAGAAAMSLGGVRGARAQEQVVKVALIAPMSGPWARQGELMKKGGDLAIKHINEQGGIKSMGGAKMQLVAIDAGDSAEKAKNAAQRLVSSETDIVGGTGAWLSSFTLAVTEVTERAEVPWLTLSYSDQITSRGFKYVFQTSLVASEMAAQTVPISLDLAEKATGKRPKTISIIQDNTASPVAFTKALREGGLDKMGLKLVSDDIFTPPLADASPLVQKLRSARPELLLMIPTATSDYKLLLEKMNEFNLGKGRLPVVSNGAPLGTPEILKLLGKDLLEGLIFSIANWPVKGQEPLVENFKKEMNEPWMTQDSMCTYGDMWVLKEGIEAAGKADRKAVGEAMRKMETKGGSGQFFPGGGGVMKFDDKGRRIGAEIVFVQWQGGEPFTVYPAGAAVKEPIWAKG
ncbi:MAG TPA: ABC transporter substrate-binding protein [Hyphomicrobiaceae bacterium]|nr:ABC transporter substrate-binding protein [Hyphomicrobiaceae bacterium]